MNQRHRLFASPTALAGLLVVVLGACANGVEGDVSDGGAALVKGDGGKADAKAPAKDASTPSGDDEDDDDIASSPDASDLDAEPVDLDASDDDAAVDEDAAAPDDATAPPDDDQSAPPPPPPPQDSGPSTTVYCPNDPSYDLKYATLGFIPGVTTTCNDAKGCAAGQCCIKSHSRCLPK